MIPDRLEGILDRKRLEVDRLPASPVTSASDTFQQPRRNFAAALTQPGISIIAEIKRRSPSKGAIAPTLESARLAAEYETGGAAALSCLTDAEFFGAKPDDLPTARRATTLPILRKDFIIDPRQIHESAAMGADAILLIARVLPAETLHEFITIANTLQLAALVEVHDEEDITKALDAGAAIIGVNNRDLATFDVSLDNAIRLRPRIPDVCIAVSESGIHTRDDVEQMENAGYDAVLVGESLVRSADPTHAIQSLLGIDAPQISSKVRP